MLFSFGSGHSLLGTNHTQFACIERRHITLGRSGNKSGKGGKKYSGKKESGKAGKKGTTVPTDGAMEKKDSNQERK